RERTKGTNEMAGKKGKWIFFYEAQCNMCLLSGNCKLVALVVTLCNGWISSKGLRHLLCGGIIQEGAHLCGIMEQQIIARNGAECKRAKDKIIPRAPEEVGQARANHDRCA